MLIDALPLLIRSAGVKSYLYYWIDALTRAAGRDTIRTCPSLRRLGPLNHERSVSGTWATWSGLAFLGLVNFTRLPVADWAARGADIFHTTSLLTRPPRRTRLTATIHDLTSRLMPELHRSVTVRADESFAEVLRRADAAIADSQSTKDDAVRILGLAPEKIAVIYPGVPDSFFQVQPEDIQGVREKYRLNRPFVLFVGTIEPRKNIDALLDAYEGLPASIREEFDMILAGPIGWARESTKARLSRVRYLGYLPEPDIAPLTAAAAVFAFPSLYEGFGFPAAQALAAGVPVITSNISSLPEVTGDAGVLVDSRSTAEIRAALSRLLLSATLRADLSKRGRCQAQQFRWEHCAAQSLRFFESVLSR